MVSIAESLTPLADRRAIKTLRVVLIGTLICGVLAAIALPIVGPRARGHRLSIDWMMAASVALICVASATALRRRSIASAMAMFAILVAIVTPLLVSVWAPTLVPAGNPRSVAHRLRALSAGANEYAFFGENFSMPLIYELRTIAPVIGSDQELIELTTRRPRTLVLSLSRPNRDAPPIPANFVQLDAISTEERTLRV